MKQKLLGFVAVILIILGGAVAPAFSVVTGTFEVNRAYAEPATEGQETSGMAKSTKEIDCGLNFVCGAVIATSQFIMFAPFLLSSAAGLVMDYSIWYSIQSSTYTQFDGNLSADGTQGEEGLVVKGWKLVRDFTNLIFIFALFVIAFTLILNLDDNKDGAPLGLDPKRTIARVIIMALLVNFSFFLGRSVIDITNVMAQSFYNKIAAAPQATQGSSMSTGSQLAGTAGDPTSFYENAFGVRSISTGIIAKVNPQALILSNTQVTGDGVFWKSYDWSIYVMVIFMSVVAFLFNLFLMYIFGSLALIFLGRTVGLYLGIIISPIAFVSYTVPMLQKQAYIGFDDWLKQFMSLSFMAPIFLFFLYIIIQFFNISGLDKGSGQLAVTAQILVKLGLIGFLLVYAKNIAKDLAGKAGEMVTSAVSSVATGVAIGAGAIATGGMSGLGRLAYRSATEKLTQGGGAVTEGAGRAIFGDKKFDAMKEQWKINGGALRNLGTNPRSALTAATRIATAGDENGLGTAFRAGKVANRQADIEEAKKIKKKLEEEEKKKKSWDKYIGDGSDEGKKEAAAARKRVGEIDKEIEKINKEIADDVLTDKEKKEKKNEISALNKEKRTQMLPSDQRKAELAKRAFEAEDKRQKAAGTDANVTAAANKIAGLDTGIQGADTSISEADKRLADIATERAAVEQELLDKEKELADQVQASTNAAAGLQAAQQQAAADKAAADKALADKDDEINRAPKSGFGAAANLENLRVEREALVQRQATTDADLKMANRALTQNSDSVTRLAAQRDQLDDKRTQLDREQTAVADKKATNEAKKKDLEDKKQIAEAEKAVLDQEKANNVATLANLEAAAAAAKKQAQINKDKAPVERDLQMRLRANKQDTDNRRRNEDEIKKLQTKLAGIVSGGATNTPPPNP